MQDQVTQGTMKVNQLFILESKVTMLIIATTFKELRNNKYLLFPVLGSLPN